MPRKSAARDAAGRIRDIRQNYSGPKGTRGIATVLISIDGAVQGFQAAGAWRTWKLFRPFMSDLAAQQWVFGDLGRFGRACPVPVRYKRPLRLQLVTNIRARCRD